MSSTTTFLEELDRIPPAARMILPAAVLTLVSRKKHPIVWWLFGVIPMATAVAGAITEKRLFSSTPSVTSTIGPIEVQT